MKKIFTTILLLAGFKFSYAQFLIQASSPVDVCYPFSVTLSVVSPQAGYTYTWFIGGYGCPNTGPTAPYNSGPSLQALITGEFYCMGMPPGGGFPEISNPITVRVLPGMPGSIYMPAPGLFTGNSNCVTSASFCIPAIYYQNWPGTIIKWYKNNVLISGATSGSYTATSEGYYKYTITSACVTALSDSTLMTSIPVATITPAGTTTFCANGNVVLNANTGTNLTYQWKKNGSNIGGATNSAYTATTSGSYTVVVTNVYGCSKTSSATTVTVNPLPTVSFTGLAASYNLNASPATLTGSPTGGTFSGPGISGNTFTPATAGIGGPYTIVYYYTDGNGCSNTSSQQTVVVCALPAKPGTITSTGGNTKVCPGDTKTYSIPAVSGATSYTWTPPPGGAIANGQGTTSVTINYTAGFIANDSLRVVANNTCGSGAARALSIKRNNPATPGTINGQNFGVCSLLNVTYSVTSVSGITYNWSYNTTAAVIATGQGTNAITVNYNAGYLLDTLKVTGSNACGTSAVKKLTVRAVPATPVSIAGNPAVCANQQDVPYSISPVTSTTNYTWVGPTGSHISDGIITSSGTTLITTATSVTVDYATSGGTLKVRANNACGSGSYRSVTITIVCRESMFTNNIFDVNVFPNPSSGDFVFEIDNAMDENISIEVFDVIGKIILSETIHNSTFIIQRSTLSPGIYSAVVTVGENKKVLRIVKTD